MAFSVGFVCTGNVCRSVAAERLFLARLSASTHARSAEVRVWSAGTHGLVGEPVDPPTAQALRELGVDPSGHVARRLDPAEARDSDLILCAATEHRAYLLQSVPSLMRRTFTLREFARLASSQPAQAALAPVYPDLAQIPTAVSLLRGQVDPPAPGDDDIADPFRRDLDTARRSVQAIDQAVDRIVRTLGLS